MFDDTKTGIMRNGTDRIVISCKAKGRPRPDLQLNLYNEYGPNLLESGLYKVSYVKSLSLRTLSFSWTCPFQ